MLTCWQVLLNKVCAIAQWLLRNIGWMTRNRLCSAGDQMDCSSDEIPFNGFNSWADGIWVSGVMEPESFDFVSLDWKYPQLWYKGLKHHDYKIDYYLDEPGLSALLSLRSGIILEELFEFSLELFDPDPLLLSFKLPGIWVSEVADCVSTTTSIPRKKNI
jgi:hypothetical protein